MPIRINSQVVYGTYKARQRKFKTTEDGHAYVLDDEKDMDVIIKMSRDFDAQDEHIFFYVNGVDQLINLCYEDTEDFDLIELYEFKDELL